MELPNRVGPFAASAERARRFYFRLVLLQLVFAAAIPAVALMMVLSATAPYLRYELESVTLLFTLGLVAQLYTSVSHPDKRWYSFRAAAESMTTLCWRYAMGAGEFPVGDPDSERVVRERLHQVELATPEFPHPSTVPSDADASVPASMTTLRSRPWTERRDVYLRERVGERVGWYLRAGHVQSRMHETFTGGVVGIQVLGIGIALWLLGEHSSSETGVAFIALLAVLISSSLAWSQAHQYSELAAPYRSTARELSQRKAEIESERSEEGFLRAVLAVESTIVDQLPR